MPLRFTFESTIFFLQVILMFNSFLQNDSCIDFQGKQSFIIPFFIDSAEFSRFAFEEV